MAPPLPIQLGFAEKVDEPLVAHPTFEEFPNKIGGQPTSFESGGMTNREVQSGLLNLGDLPDDLFSIWLNPERLLKADELTCGETEHVGFYRRPCLGLQEKQGQIFEGSFSTRRCPKREAFSHVNILRRGGFPVLHPGGPPRRGLPPSTVPIRLQKRFMSPAVLAKMLPEVNPYSNPAEGSEAFSTPVCGIDGSKQCSRCRSAPYCSREHQLLDWNAGGHKQLCRGGECSTSAPSSSTAASMRPAALTAALFPEYELVSEEEPMVPKTCDDFDDDEKDADKDFEETEVDVDKAFLKFQKRVELEPEQVIR
ncbi:hypothetical protein BDK51DRAFT_33065, partial [Blyttiomyces helicus]